MIKQLFRRKSVDRILQDRQAGFTEAEHNEASLNRTLGVRDLTAFGIAAIIGAGIFSTIGTASANGGPAITMLFVFVAIACGFSALSYAEFASLVPVSGSAYTYAYVAFGELIAWIIGWDLLMEYAIGNIAVAISWSDYFTSMLDNIKIPALGIKRIHVPDYLTMDFATARKAFASGDVNDAGYKAWIHAPALGPVHMVFDLPALCIVAFVTWLVYIGIRESRTASNLMVALKLCVILLVIAVGIGYINTSNWVPFAPNGVGGVLKGVSAVFFAYIGFDAISTTAEECKNPQRDLPRSMFYSLIICTVLYIAIALVLTGMVHYSNLNVGDPLSFVFRLLHDQAAPGLSRKFLGSMFFIVSISAVVATTSVLLVFQLGQPRIWMSMSRDGLLPPAFSRIHPKFRTPSFATIVTGLLVAVPALFMNLNEVVALTSIGTLFAFVLVNGGVLLMQHNDRKQEHKAKFRTPYVNARWVMPFVTLGVFVLIWKFFPETVDTMLRGDVSASFTNWLFALAMVAATVLAFVKQLSLIPLLGLLSCFWLMTQEGPTNWARFGIWLVVGLVIYFFYSYTHSKLHTRE